MYLPINPSLNLKVSRKDKELFINMNNFWREEDGTTSIEYALLIASITLSCVIVFTPLKEAIKKPFEDVIKTVEHPTHEASAVNTEKFMRSPMHGRIVAMNAKSGDKVSKGDVLYTLEAMKMQTIVRADQDAIITKIYVNDGQVIENNQNILEFK